MYERKRKGLLEERHMRYVQHTEYVVATEGTPRYCYKTT